MEALPYGTKVRKFELVGDSYIKCPLECCTPTSGQDNHAVLCDVKVNGNNRLLHLCMHPHAPVRGENKRSRHNVCISALRVCLVKQPEFDTASKIEDPI